MISIVVCTYNDSNFLERALKSCLIQDLPKEIILVDDGSTDPINSRVIDLINYNSDSIRLIKHPINMGLSAARNTGVASSKYDFIITLDADDFFFPRSLLSLVYYATTNDNYKSKDIFYGGMTSSGKLKYPYTGEITREILLDSNPIFCSSMFKKSIWEKVGGYKVRKGPHYEDWNFWCKCYMAGAKFQYVPALVYEHTERPDSMLRTLGVNKDKYVALATEELRDFQ